MENDDKLKLVEENLRLLQQAREERNNILNEAKTLKERIIQEAKEVAKSEAGKIIDDAAKVIRKQQADAKIDIEETLKKSIQRQIEFPPQLVNTGLSILNQFTSIVNQKYANANVKIKIEQNKNNIKFTISSVDDDVIESIEHDLVTFGKIIKGDADISQLTSDPLEKIKLEHRLELIALELKLTRELAVSMSNQTSNFEAERKNFYNLIDKTISNAASHADIIKNLIEQNQHDDELVFALQTVKEEISASRLDAHSIIESLEAVKKISSPKAKKVGDYVISFLSSTASGTVVQVIKKYILDTLT